MYRLFIESLDYDVVSGRHKTVETDHGTFDSESEAYDYLDETVNNGSMYGMFGGIIAHRVEEVIEDES